jgi:hypothetical protein
VINAHTNTIAIAAVIRDATRVAFRPNDANQIRVAVEAEISANETESDGRTKRCLYLLESCSVDDPYS